MVTLESKTKDMAEILKMLEPKLEVKTEDGYEGVLSLDHTTIQVEAVGYGTSSRTVTAERTYPNLSDADVSLVPKSVNENGRTPDPCRCEAGRRRLLIPRTATIFPFAIPPW